MMVSETMYRDRGLLCINYHWKRLFFFESGDFLKQLLKRKDPKNEHLL